MSTKIESSNQVREYPDGEQPCHQAIPPWIHALDVSCLVEFLSWWLWRRWRIYCPSRSVALLFDQNRRLVMTPHGLMEFPSRDEFENALFHYDEAFVSPCAFNETNCGGYRGRWIPKIGLLSMEMPEDG